MKQLSTTFFITLCAISAVFVVTGTVSAEWEYTNYNIPYTVESPQKPVPVVRVWSDASQVSYGGSTTIYWDSDYVASYGGWCDTGGYGTDASGSFNTGSLTTARTFTVTCYN